MTITIDTNVLVRLITADDLAQTELAQAEVRAADRVVVTLVALCETVWVLRSRFGFGRQEIAAAIEDVLDIPTLIVDRPVVEAALRHLRQGGDFTDSVIAGEGRGMGGAAFVSFDKKAVRLLNASGLVSRFPEIS